MVAQVYGRAERDARARQHNLLLWRGAGEAAAGVGPSMDMAGGAWVLEDRMAAGVTGVDDGEGGGDGHPQSHDVLARGGGGVLDVNPLAVCVGKKGRRRRRRGGRREGNRCAPENVNPAVHGSS